MFWLYQATWGQVWVFYLEYPAGTQSFRVLSISGVPIRDTQAVQSVPKLLLTTQDWVWLVYNLLFRVLDCPLVLTNSLYYVNHSGNVSLLSLFILLVRVRVSSVNWNICVYEYLYNLVCFDYSQSPKGLLFIVDSYVDILAVTVPAFEFKWTFGEGSLLVRSGCKKKRKTWSILPKACCWWSSSHKNYFICATLGLREHLKATVLEVFLKYLKIPESLQSLWIKKMM